MRTAKRRAGLLVSSMLASTIAGIGVAGTATAAPSTSAHVQQVNVAGSAVTTVLTLSTMKPATGEPPTTQRIPKPIADLFRKFPRLVEAVKRGWNAFRNWYNAQPWYVRAVVRAVSPALSLYELYELLRSFV